jgi:hypothetical protein
LQAWLYLMSALKINLPEPGFVLILPQP